MIVALLLWSGCVVGVLVVYFARVLWLRRRWPGRHLSVWIGLPSFLLTLSGALVAVPAWPITLLCGLVAFDPHGGGGWLPMDPDRFWQLTWMAGHLALTASLCTWAGLAAVRYRSFAALVALPAAVGAAFSTVVVMPIASAFVFEPIPENLVVLRMFVWLVGATWMVLLLFQALTWAGRSSGDREEAR